jgi:septal ring factor EnvC (AmiA/AmiB activator)
MSSDGSGVGSMRRELDAIELDAVREREARKRFEDRIAAKKFKSDRLARDAQEPTRNRDVFRRKFDELNQQLARLEEALADARRGKQAI